MWQFIGRCDATASAGPDGKVMIVSHLTDTDGHKVPGTTLGNMDLLQPEATTFYLFGKSIENKTVADSYF